jgi:predicted Fe-S protein YdhL (DUF1289 family)
MDRPVGRPLTCDCGACKKCRRRDERRAAWQALSLEERRAIIARRDPERVKANERARYLRHREDRIALQAQIVARNPALYNGIRKAWIERNPDARRAQVAVGHALRAGTLERGPCEVCGATRVHGHHDDYSRPLDVRWLCPRHHSEHHATPATNRAS